jgi:hypothetical protein
MQNAESGATRNIEDAKKDAADLHWLAFLLTGRRNVSIDIAVDTVPAQNGGNPFFTAWMRAWSRRIVIAKALAAIRVEIAESAPRTSQAHVKRSTAALRGWSLSPHTTKAQIEEALLAIDIFPRVVVVLSIFEGMRTADVAILLDENAAVVRKGEAFGLRELIGNLAREKEPVAPGQALVLRLALATR